MDVSPEMFKKEVDFVWASPPCNAFSIASISSHWEKKSERLRLPKDDEAVKGVGRVLKALRLIQALDPQYWFMENPRGGLRKIIGEPQHDQRRELDKELLVKEQKDANYPGTLTYCQFGDTRMKPTDLWGEHPEGFEYRFCGNGGSCHESSPRGSKNSGTQGRNKGAERWKVPRGLADHVFKTVNSEI